MAGKSLLVDEINELKKRVRRLEIFALGLMMSVVILTAYSLYLSYILSKVVEIQLEIVKVINEIVKEVEEIGKYLITQNFNW